MPSFSPKLKHKIKNLSSICQALFILIGIAVPTQVFAAQDLPKPGSGIRKLKSNEIDGIIGNQKTRSFVYHKCWDIRQIPDKENEFYSRVKLQPTAKCPKTEKGTWTIEVRNSSPNGERPPGDHPTDIILNNMHYQFYRIWSESASYVWHVQFLCGEKHFMIAQYEDKLDKEDLDKVVKTNEIPSFFKDFVASFKCE
jgi:hypothetical protein